MEREQGYSTNAGKALNPEFSLLIYHEGDRNAGARLLFFSFVFKPQ
jgi:hypothetical protein